MSDPVFQHQHRVTYSECTVGNHVYYARYLDILEEARGEMFRHAGWPLLKLQESGVAFPVIEARVAYKHPARYDDVIAVELWMTEAVGIRLSFGFCIRNAAGNIIAEGETRHVCAGLDEKPKRPPQGLMQELGRYLRRKC